MKYKVIFIIYLACITLSCHSQTEPKEYFVRSCEFVCDYPFNDTTKWAITCRVWGLLKYYHPNVTAGKLDWDKILLDRLENIHSASTPEMVNTELKKMLDVAGEYTHKRDDDWNDSLNMNVNLCWLDHSFLDNTLQDELKKIASLSVQKSPYYGIDFDSAMHLMTPNEKVYDLDITTSYHHRLLSLFRYWNVIYYFSPHKYLMDKSWDKTLSESIFPFINATDEQSYKIAFLKLAAALNDGHGYITIEKGYPDESQNIIEIVEGKTVVRIDGGGLKKGDIVNRIGNRDINQIRDSLSVLIPASTQGNKEYRINCYVAEMIFFRETDIILSRNGQKRIVHTFPITSEKIYSSSYQWITDDIGYVDLSILTTDEMDWIFQLFSDTKGIVFDLRKTGPYSYDGIQFECHLSDQKVIRLFSLIVPDVRHPGAYYWAKNLSMAIPDSIECPLFQGKIVFLIDESTQSSLESRAWGARTNYHATLIGRPTSGALGHVIRFPLLENHTAIFSGVGAFSSDGTELQRKGIIPDIEVYPTMESIKAGKDEILEAAIEYLNKN
jgi:C-terminal processing protease CtpA/Prc